MKEQFGIDTETRNALERLETSLATPVVSGELAAWVEEVDTSWQAVSAQIHLHATELHPLQYKQITSEDPELLPKVEQLRLEDAALEQDCASLSRIIEGLTKYAPKFELDEEKLRQHTAHVAEAGIALVNRVKRQEVAIQTWFMEAFNRDRGIAD